MNPHHALPSVNVIENPPSALHAPAAEGVSVHATSLPLIPPFRIPWKVSTRTRNIHLNTTHTHLWTYSYSYAYARKGACRRIQTMSLSAMQSLSIPPYLTPFISLTCPWFQLLSMSTCLCVCVAACVQVRTKEDAAVKPAYPSDKIRLGRLSFKGESPRMKKVSAVCWTLFCRCIVFHLTVCLWPLHTFWNIGLLFFSFCHFFFHAYISFALSFLLTFYISFFWSHYFYWLTCYHQIYEDGEVEEVTVEYAKPFQFLNLGVLAYIGASQALAQISVDDKTILGSGPIGFLLWRGIYWSKQVSWRNRVLVGLDWVKGRLFGRDIGSL